MTETRLRDPVVIVGAGPAGAALAYLLARRGVPTLLLERHADLAREFRGEGLQPSGLTCLAQMGLSGPLARVPQRELRRALIVIGERTLENRALARRAGDVRLVSQPGLLDMLTREAAASPGFSLRLGALVRDLQIVDGRVRGVVVSGPAGPETIAASLVIAADGRGSTVRRRLDLPLTDIEQGFDVLWARGDLSALVDDHTSRVEILRAGGFVAVFPSPAGGHQIGVIIPKGSYRELRARGQATSLAWLRGQVSSALDRALAGAQLSKPVLLDVVCGRVGRWSGPGALLLGDAAHPMSPVGGQGINIALRDAIVAANHLVPALLAGGDPAALDRACAAIEAERTPEVVAIQALQTAQGRRFRPLSPLVYAALPWLLRLAPATARLFRRRRAFQYGLAPVRLTV